MAIVLTFLIVLLFAMYVLIAMCGLGYGVVLLFRANNAKEVILGLVLIAICIAFIATGTVYILPGSPLQ